MESSAIKYVLCHFAACVQGFVLGLTQKPSVHVQEQSYGTVQL